MALAVALIGLVALLATVRGVWLAAAVYDNRVVAELAEQRRAWLTAVMRPLGYLATSPALQILWLINIAVMAFYRRWRHMLVWLVSSLLVNNLAGVGAEIVQRPRPLAVEILGPWHGFSMPSLPVAVTACFLVSTLYALVPAGRPRQIGKLVVACVLFLTVLSRVYLAQELVTDAIVGLVIGVTIPLCGFRLFCPNEVFPVTYKRGRTAHLDVTGARHDAIVQSARQRRPVVSSPKRWSLSGLRDRVARRLCV